MQSGENPSLCIAAQDAGRLAGVAREQGWTITYQHEGLTEQHRRAVAIVVVDNGDDVHGSRLLFPHALVVSEHDLQDEQVSPDLNIPANASAAQLKQFLEHGRSFWQRNSKILELASEISMRRHRMHQMAEIGALLSTQVGLDDLLETILSEGRRLSNCEGASLYLINEELSDQPVLVFKLAQNDAFDVPFMESVLPLTPASLAGYVATSGDEINVPDVYEIPDNVPFRFNRSFDEKIGYRTQSTLVLPMRDHRDVVVGVLQFINRLDPRHQQPVAFDDESAEVLRALASQAAVSIQRNTLVSDIHRLFEGFVQASVRTIEQRDPTTSGHSFRVADSTIMLLEALPKSDMPRFRDLQLSEEHLREVRYAALLHDFGKVGVPERVLLKAKKLAGDRLEILQHRFELQRERLRRRAVEKELDLIHHGGMDIEVARRRVHRELEKKLSVLDDYWEWVTRANEPNVLDKGEFDHLLAVRQEPFRALDGTISGLIEDEDLLALSVRRGTLTPAERREIQAHVVGTKEFLAELPWPRELANVPEIAGAHHEKLDGSGYPDGLVGEQIPLAARVMTVCDIFDALTAMDRPYKSPMSPVDAVAILEDEVRRGLLDADVVDVFIGGKLFETVGVVVNG